MRKLVLLLIVVIVFTGCESRLDEKEFAVLEEVATDYAHYQIVSDMEYVYLVNVREGQTSILRRRNGELLTVLPLDSDIDYGGTVTEINPMTSGFNFSEDIPFTYSGSYEEISKYLRALYNSGYTLVHLIGTHQSVDIVLTKDEVQYRVLVLENVFKVFEDVQVNQVDPATYINERIRGGDSNDE